MAVFCSKQVVVPVAPAETILFRLALNGVYELECEKGMTWEQFASSVYNPTSGEARVTIDTSMNQVTVNYGMSVVFHPGDNDVWCLPSDEIQENVEYYAEG